MKKRTIKVGDLTFGNGEIYVQSMLNAPADDISANVEQAKRLVRAGCDVIRVAIPRIENVQLIPAIKEAIGGTPAPVVADIHFDYKIAIAAVEAGADKIRINPGNIGGPDGLKAVCDAAGAAGIPMRIGVNGGSLQEDLRGLYQSRPAEALAESAFRNIERVRDMGFSDVVFSVKSSDVLVNTEA
ncbi:MAG: flavodoxin-dependent (E)-4-hydroxy-3-methylbut-2-enyl-diphosphate synthase, partial [Oscillospiraceae bacterium]|nr:flavodoxin-dependent (E)-4-hydroxy-3-methylbut-2-enyl-diphosphate synthase [Oscillospiraceae bacterium]